LRDAVHLRDRGHCRYPGCQRTRWLQIHHAISWEQGGTTDIENLLLLCTRHHKTIHDQHITLHRSTHNTIHATRPDGTPITTTPPTLTTHDLDALIRNLDEEGEEGG
ncbi:HNH endonuclease, partial [Frankia canadensis]|uniref:HNH endonuclease n=1 Tax=Frankia canadensis TaxID=1836972 RepID=UPI0010551CC7